MVKIFLDTNIIIDYLRTKKGLLFELLELQKLQRIKIYCSSITVVEIFAERSSVLQEDIIRNIFSVVQIIAVDHELGKKVGETKREMNNEVTLGDVIIGVSAVTLNAQLATNNQKHFAKIPDLKFFRPV